jgi:ubiquinone/menaquinone biosynthesis C-methylase UbiE
VLDVGTGTGVAAVTAAKAGARVSALNFTPELLVEARENGRIAGHPEIAWQEGDAEKLPYPDGSFDVVVSQFGHMFAPVGNWGSPPVSTAFPPKAGPFSSSPR